jgi:chromosome segregation protein
MQQSFNELVQQLRTKENEKNLASQRHEYLKKGSPVSRIVLVRAEGQNIWH